MLRIKVNESEAIEVNQAKDEWYINGQIFEGDVIRLDTHRFHILWQGQSYNVEVVEHSPAQKTATLRINGQLLVTSAQDRYDLLLERMGLKQAASNRLNNLKAPMPGLIQSIAVQEGDNVEKGTTLLVLVAMKMENTIKAPGEGTVKTIHISPGSSVEKNQVLIEFV
jgi:biotin carboxyl carrier protein